ncbi:MAG: Lrp/AsnC family transcriptional regulator, regulator for asnA, asnC and gidA [Clostridia bacterium]|jgi:Lrp/AsnC family transcriptional regulator for asnA, asnC and gidA|nr:Lrp/AsnC family transcriptional regulator [Clostridiales bacterium]MDK2984585.1 Lrp/AsnC family transcriptional regulator, regulator for asnA, asnC and gidA [Clostridia bacterium]
MMNLDKIEKKVIELLQQDGRMSFVDMANRLGVAEATVRRKYNRLIKDGIIQITAVSDPHTIGYNFPVIIGVNVDVKKLEHVINELKAMKEVVYLAVTTGLYDLIIQTYFSSSEKLKDFLYHKLTKIDGVKETQTSVLLNVVKQSNEIGVAE